MATYIHLVRHASIQTRAGAFIGSTDLPLSGAGRREARALAELVGRLPVRRCVVSPLRRAQETAGLACPDLPTVVDEDLREIGFGAWEEQTFGELAAADPAAIAKWNAFEPDFRFPGGGESLGEFFGRVGAVAQRLAADPHEAVLAITHGGVIRALICHLLGLPSRSYVLFTMARGSLTTVRMHDGKGVLAALNVRPAGETDDG